MRRCLAAIIVVAALVAAGCGGDALTTASPTSVDAYVVWSHSNGGEPRIFAASSVDPSPAAVSAMPAGQYWPAVSRDWIAWMDQSSGDADIVLLDRKSGKTRVAVADEGSQWFPAVSADWLVWTDSARDRKQVRALSLRGGERLVVGKSGLSMSEPRPQVSGSWVTWLQQDLRTTTVWAYDLEARRLVRIARGRCTAPSIADRILAYRDVAGIHCVDPASGDELRLIQLGRNSNVVGPPLMSDSRVLWTAASKNGTVYELWGCDVSRGQQRSLVTIRDMDPSMGLAVNGDSLVYIGVPDDEGAVPVNMVDLGSGRASVVARQPGLLTGPAVVTE